MLELPSTQPTIQILAPKLSFCLCFLSQLCAIIAPEVLTTCGSKVTVSFKVQPWDPSRKLLSKFYVLFLCQHIFSYILYKNFQIPLKVSIDSYEQIKFKHCHKHGNNNKLFLEAEQRLNWFEFIK